MRVGLHLQWYSPQMGGGYTFETDILSAFLESAESSSHSYVVLHPQGKKDDHRPIMPTERVKVLQYSPPGLVHRAMRRVSRYLPARIGPRKQSGYLDRVIADSGIEFMWCLSPTPVELDVPYLAIVWDLQHRLQPWFPEVSAKGVWKRREDTYTDFLQRATAIIVGTKAGRREVETFYGVPPERIKILPLPTPGFALDAHQDPVRDVLTKHGIPAGYLLYPAQFWSHKNHANLLLAVRKLRDDCGLELPVVLVGSDKGNQEYIRQLVRELNLRRVYFLGFVSPEDLVALYQNALALTFVSFFGPENLPPLEAFALGCPVIASRVAGAEEQLGDAALFVDPADPNQIATAIRALHEDSALRGTLVCRGYDRARRWTAHDFVKGVFSILDEFAAVRRCWGAGS